MRIVILDDRAEILLSLTRSLERRRPGWDIVCCQSYEDALDAMRHSEVHAIISDLNMPVSGEEVLNEIRERFPRTYRLAYSGDLALGLRLQSLGLCHQFFPKGTPADNLIAALEPVVEATLLEDDSAVRNILMKCKRISRPPQIALATTRLLRNEDFNMNDLTHLLEQDPLITASILKAANSALFATSTPIRSVRGAIARLGLKYIQGVVLAAELFSRVAGKRSVEKFVSTLWAHSFDVACAADRLAQSLGLSSEVCESSFTAGILHDFGKLLMLDANEEETLLVFDEEDGEERMVQEVNCFGAHHAYLGGTLLRLWQLPYEITESVLYHHNSDYIAAHPGPRPLTCVAAINFLCVGGNLSATSVFSEQMLKEGKRCLASLGK